MQPHSHWTLPLLAAAALSAGGCSSAPERTQTGFLSSYARLEEVSGDRMRYIGPEFKNYRSFIVDPVQISTQRQELSPEDRAEVARYFHEALVKTLQERGYTVTHAPAAGTARVRVAVTGVKQSTWWMKIHPASSLAGAGRGGAAMEGEIIDAVTGDQLAAVVQAGTGSQFTIGNFSTVSDLKNVIDSWAKATGDRLDELSGRDGKTPAGAR